MASISWKVGGFLQGMTNPTILMNALKVSLVVGAALNVINQGQRVWEGQGLLVGHALLNFLVPFCVSAYSGAKARSQNSPAGQDGTVEGGLR